MMNPSKDKRKKKKCKHLHKVRFNEVNRFVYGCLDCNKQLKIINKNKEI